LSSPAEIGILEVCRPAAKHSIGDVDIAALGLRLADCYAIEAIMKRGFDLASQSWINRLSAPLIAFALTVGVSASTVHAVGDPGF
jgi:hypothetical protein